MAERLETFMSELRPLIEPVLGPNPDTFAKRVKNTRNYYVHYSGNAPEGWALVLLTRRLWFVVRARLIMRLGMRPTLVRPALEMAHDWDWLVGQADE